ncbi:NADPH2:quinone reductase [Chitinivorax tropicus]|uniref:NADPH2:quinone reductase n=1 Tax=Chitinivorax tropicus TaxID=714531 RepID=A0A840MNL5_9PROT|nr:quinone oxidoreductase [Chitinivorax tropicus]MBB5018342.1 NADPH2:quinone reductase [Chitinivorax tropicus]
MSKTIQMTTIGGPEVMQLIEQPLGEPGPGEVRVRHHAIGLNFIDVYFRSGVYPLPSLPSGLGKEGAGVVEAVGPGVTGWQVGDRVAYAGGDNGAYSESRLIPAAQLVRLPDSVSFELAAAAMLKGLTAQYLLRRTYRVKPGDTILIHAAAGGVGLMVCQWAKALGATVIGTVSTPEKAALAQAHGCDHPLIHSAGHFPTQVRELTGGQGVNVVYDSIGKDTFLDSLDCLRPLGMMVSFGNASGVVESFSPQLLSQKGSLFLTRPVLFHYTAQRSDLEQMAAELFEVLADGTVKVEIHQRYALADVAQAHRDLEARRTTGSTILIP